MTSFNFEKTNVSICFGRKGQIRSKLENEYPPNVKTLRHLGGVRADPFVVSLVTEAQLRHTRIAN